MAKPRSRRPAAAAAAPDPRFDPVVRAFAHTRGQGRTLKGWIEVTSASADWVALAKQAQRLAAASRAKKR
jgi:hypothetical protein